MPSDVWALAYTRARFHLSEAFLGGTMRSQVCLKIETSAVVVKEDIVMQEGSTVS